MTKTILLFSLCASLLWGSPNDKPALTQEQKNAYAAVSTLKPRQPNWRTEIFKSYPNGNLEIVLLYEPEVDGGEHPVKQVSFYENGQIKSEVDLGFVDKDSLAAKEWKSSFVPHGTRVDLSPEGHLSQIIPYHFGVIEGECKSFSPDGKVASQRLYVKGKLDGESQSFFENGQIKERAFYREGNLEGDFVQYYENGTKSVSIPHAAGKVEGTAFEWFPSGVLKSQRQFSEGALHGDGKNPAYILYDEERNVVEVLDFREGVPVGMHLRYHKNGKEAYRVACKQGKKEGKEQFFAEDGELLGEGFFKEGKAVGKHWKNHPNQQRAFVAEFGKDGNLLQPIVEFNEEGQKVRQFFLIEEKLEGPYFEWYADGSAKLEYNYKENLFDGEQKEYFPSHQLKLCTHYSRGKHHGLHEEWYEDGILARRVHFSLDKKDGQLGEWFPSGSRKTDAYFQDGLAEGTQSEWHENGALKGRVEFAAGLKEGWQREWNEEGDLIFEACLSKDQFEGVVLSWWKQDCLKNRFHFSQGKKEGKQEWFFEDGTLERLAYYKNDLLDGELTHWFEDGSIRLSQTYAMGKPVGHHQLYFSKEKEGVYLLAQDFYYDNEGKFHGEQKTYLPNGIIQAMVSYDHGALNGIKEIRDERGIVVEKAHYVQNKLEGEYFQRSPDLKEVIFHFHDNMKNGPHFCFYPPNERGEKTKAIEAYFENDQLEGKVVEYNERGLKIAETPYVHGKQEGVATLYTPEGKWGSSVTFKEDKKNGSFIQYFPSGAVFKDTLFVDDKREGEEKTYHEEGSLASSCMYKNDELDGLSRSWNKQGILVFEAEYAMGKKEGKFNKYYDDGSLYIEQTFMADQPQGVKKKYDRDGKITVSNVGVDKRAS
jgi:antitoxin component YwqK of YwqJK toxin-antitoxin module